MKKVKPLPVRMRPAITAWAASLALICGATLISPDHERATGIPNSGIDFKDSPFTTMSKDPGTNLSTSANEVSTRVAASLVSYSLTRSTAVHTAPSSSRTSLATLIVKRSVPIHLSIPAIGVSAPLSVLGLNADGSPQVPSSWYVPGWYKFDWAPGQLGSAVILGHVDSVAGPAVFYRIRDLKAGNRVIVKLKDGVTVRYEVLYVREYLKSQFPTRLVYGAHPYPALQLVTCGGTFDYQTHHYLYSIVAFTKLVKR